jgi:hypothetical protein
MQTIFYKPILYLLFVAYTVCFFVIGYAGTKVIMALLR